MLRKNYKTSSFHKLIERIGRKWVSIIAIKPLINKERSNELFFRLFRYLFIFSVFALMHITVSFAKNHSSVDLHSSHQRLVVLEDRGDTISMNSLMDQLSWPDQNGIDRMFEEQASYLKGQPIDANQILNDDKEPSFSAGFVKKHRLKLKHFPNMPLVIMGDDPYSRSWVQANAAYFKKIQAVGIVDHVGNLERMRELEQISGLILVPASLEGFSKVVGTNHYPFLIYQGWVVQ